MDINIKCELCGEKLSINHTAFEGKNPGDVWVKPCWNCDNKQKSIGFDEGREWLMCEILDHVPKFVIAKWIRCSAGITSGTIDGKNTKVLDVDRFIKE